MADKDKDCKLNIMEDPRDYGDQKTVETTEADDGDIAEIRPNSYWDQRRDSDLRELRRRLDPAKTDGFMDLKRINAAMKKVGWTVEREIETLVRVLNETKDRKSTVTIIKYLARLRFDAMGLMLRKGRRAKVAKPSDPTDPIEPQVDASEPDEAKELDEIEEVLEKRTETSDGE